MTYRVAIDGGPYAGEVGEGTTLYAAIAGIRGRCPGLTDRDVRWSYTAPNGDRHRCVVWGVHATNREPRSPGEIRCTHCYETLSGPDAAHRYRWEHQRGTCTDNEMEAVR